MYHLFHTIIRYSSKLVKPAPNSNFNKYFKVISLTNDSQQYFSPTKHVNECDSSTNLIESDRLVTVVPFFTFDRGENERSEAHPRSIPPRLTQVDPGEGGSLEEGYRSRGLSVRGLTVLSRRYISGGVHAGVTQFVVTNEHNMIMLAALARFNRRYRMAHPRFVSRTHASLQLRAVICSRLSIRH